MRVDKGIIFEIINIFLFLSYYYLKKNPQILKKQLNALDKITIMVYPFVYFAYRLPMASNVLW